MFASKVRWHIKRHVTPGHEFFGGVLFSQSICAKRWMRPASVSEIQQALNTLSVSIDTKEAELKKAYLKLVRQNHPDMGGSEAKMKDITTSYNLLKGLAESEKQHFKASKNYGPGSAYTGAGTQRPPSYNNPHDAHDAYRRKYEQQARGYYKYDPHMGNYTANTNRGNTYPFGDSPFSATRREYRGLPFGTLMFRAAIIYTIASLCVIMTYRIYKDYTHDEGWAIAQASWRSERMESLHRMRQEAREKAQARERDYTERSRADVMRAREERAMTYAKRREQEMISADHGCFPRLNPEGFEGLIMRDYNDPIGVAYYVPPLPNGSPPFSGNGRFMYSTGSIARNQCIATPRNVTPSEPVPSLRPVLTMGDMARPEAVRLNAEAERQHEQQSSAADAGPATPFRDDGSRPLNMQRRAYAPRFETVAPTGYDPSTSTPAPPAAPYVIPPPPPVFQAIPMGVTTLEVGPPSTRQPASS
jgi:hypothetical protein